ncbi:hypothetical protein [Bradyrhizobium sp. Ec3.3]|uniref:hypothetical protein n=1 Tax=Bradyrhizobium sp. Ec3.3 TaxID=189753 RepID=UPI000417E2AB|nr:hypothetical protein [Bradyrhizobium sp. Ec3.3]
MSRPFIYLAGPIYGCTEGEAKNWRADFAAKLAQHCITGISPLRCEPIVGERYDVAYADPCFGDPKSILAKNFLDLRRCDMTLAYFPAPPEHAELEALIADMEKWTSDVNRDHIATLKRISKKAPQRSIGTIGELSWAYALQKPCVVVTDDPLVKSHPFTAIQPSWPILSTLDDALRLIVGIYGGYAGGKNV